MGKTRFVKVVCASFLIAALFALPACGGGDSSPASSPAEDQALAFFQAVDDGNRSEICSILSKRFVGQNGTFLCDDNEMKDALNGKIELPDVTDSQIGESEATIEVTVSGGTVYVLDMVNKNGTWYVDKIGGSADGKFF